MPCRWKISIPRQLLERELKKLKVALHTKTKVEAIVGGPAGIQAKLSNGKAIDANQALVSVGRAFNTEDTRSRRSRV